LEADPAIPVDSHIPSSPRDSQADVPQVTPPFRPSPDNYVLRRRRHPDPPNGTALSQNDDDDHKKAISPASQRPITYVVAARVRRTIREHLSAGYFFMVAPPFIHDEADSWYDARVESRLNDLRNWVWGANAALSTAFAALLALTNISSSPVPQTLLVLSCIFSFFGFAYAGFLALRIGDHKTEFLAGFLKRTKSRRYRSFWISLPLTWMAWSIFTFLSFLVALGLQIFIYDLDSTHSGQVGGNLSANFTGTDTANPSSAPNTLTLSFVQLATTGIVIVWSFFLSCQDPHRNSQVSCREETSAARYCGSRRRWSIKKCSQ